LFSLSALSVALAKGLFIEKYWGSLTGQTNSFFFFSVLKHDAIIVAVVLLIYLLSLRIQYRVIHIFLRIVIVIIAGIYCLDFAIISVFNTRITLDDVFKYALYAPAFVWAALTDAFSPVILIMILAVGAIVMWVVLSFVFKPIAIGARSRKEWMVTAAGLMLIYFLPSQNVYIHSWVYQNVFEYNFARGVNIEYSEGFTQSLKEREEKILHQVCWENAWPRSCNIVVVVLESLSMYHSRFFSGITNMMPHLDHIAAGSTSFINFYSNGFTTESALTAMLLGIPAVPPVYHYTENEGDFSFKGYYDMTESLPRKLKARGYTTEFLTSGDLSFGGKSQWLKSIGFDYLEGHDHPDYDRWKRYLFNAAPDEALYARALERVFNVKRQTPFFIMVETVSTHHPFYDPESEQRSEKKVFAYADRELKKFYDDLQRKGFFDNGIILITSDQHSMKPLSREEIQRFGNRAYARIPLIISGANFGPKIVEEPFQQIDLYSSLVNDVYPQRCVSIWRGDFLASPRQPAECIFYIRGDDRDVISVFCGDKTGYIHLEGDRTRVTGVTSLDPQIILDKVNFERLRRVSEKPSVD